jgi:hypothetical protein
VANSIPRSVARPYTGLHPAIPGPRLGTFACRYEVQSDGSADLEDAAEAFLLAGGWKVATHVFNVADTVADQKCLTIDRFIDGMQEQIFGAMGTVDIEIAIGQPLTLAINLQGKWTPPADVALPTPTYPARQPMICEALVMTIKTYAVRASKITIKLNAKVAAREDLTAAEGVGYYCITDLDPTIEVEYERETFGTFPAFTDLETPTEHGLSAVISDGTVKATIVAAKMQLRSLEPADRDGVAILRAVYQANTNAGNDCITITTAAA